jgi:hypothetical protein
MRRLEQGGNNGRAWPFGALRTFSYDVIVIDPPWDFVNFTAAGTRKGADPHYDVMALADIKALPVGHLARRDAILLLWSTGAMLPQALEVLDAWGAKYLSQIVWRKVTKSSKVRVGCAPATSRSCWRASAAGRRTRHSLDLRRPGPRAFPQARRVLPDGGRADARPGPVRPVQPGDPAGL